MSLPWLRSFSANILAYSRIHLISLYCCASTSKGKGISIITPPTSSQYRVGYENVLELDKLPEHIRRTFELEFSSAKDWNKLMISEITRKLQLWEGDTGSVPVTVGVLTVKIHYLTDHMRQNKKDKSCLRRLLHLVQKRRKLLVYLRRTNFTRYHTLLQELNIRPIHDRKYGYIKKD